MYMQYFNPSNGMIFSICVNKTYIILTVCNSPDNELTSSFFMLLRANIQRQVCITLFTLSV